MLPAVGDFAAAAALPFNVDLEREGEGSSKKGNDRSKEGQTRCNEMKRKTRSRSAILEATRIIRSRFLRRDGTLLYREDARSWDDVVVAARRVRELENSLAHCTHPAACRSKARASAETYLWSVGAK